ncbi:hypothetical protein Tco_0195581 [Tanacetum coccineum]
MELAFRDRIAIVSTPYRNLVSRFSQNAGEMSRNDYEFCKRVANHVGYRFGNEQMIKVVSSGWSFESAILGQMTYPVVSPTLDSAGSYVMQGAPFTQGTIPSIPIGGNISPEDFLPSILLLVVIIVTVVVVVVIVILIVVVVDDVSLILKLSFVIIGFLHRIKLYYLIQLSVCIPPGQGIIGVPVGPVFLLGLPDLLDGSQTSRGYGMIHNDGDRDNDAYDDDRDDDERDINNIVKEEDEGWILGGNSSSGTKKYQGSNSSDGGNTGDGVKIAGGVIGSGGEIVFEGELKELLPDEAGK